MCSVVQYEMIEPRTTFLRWNVSAIQRIMHKHNSNSYGVQPKKKIKNFKIVFILNQSQQMIPLIFISVNMYNLPLHMHLSLRLGIYIKLVLHRGRHICLYIIRRILETFHRRNLVLHSIVSYWTTEDVCFCKTPIECIVCPYDTSQFDWDNPCIQTTYHTTLSHLRTQIGTYFPLSLIPFSILFWSFLSEYFK